jgi:hypothetical protein
VVIGTHPIEVITSPRNFAGFLPQHPQEISEQGNPANKCPASLFGFVDV